MEQHTTLPKMTEVSKAFGSMAKSISKRNNQYKVRVSFADFTNACVVAKQFGRFDSVECQAIVDVII